ncbi:glycoside hydrolase family 65 protein [Enterococcus sp. LJL120]
MKKQQRIYPVEPWIVREIGFDPKNNYRNETTFSLSNGYIGTRGTLAESYPFTIDEGLEGNFINGFYDSDQVRYGEWNYGFPEWSQSLLNVPNMKKIGVSIEDELFDLFTGDIISYERKLDMKRGIVSRDIVWRSPSQRELQIHYEELVSLENKHLMFQLYEVTPLNFSGEINFHLKLDGKIQNHTRKTNPLVDYGPFGQRLQHKQVSFSDNLMYYQGTTKHSQLSLGCGCSIMFNQPTLGEANVIEESCEATYTTQGKEQQTIRLTKALAYVTNQDLEKTDFKNFIQETLAEATELDYSFYAEKQAEHFQKFWDYAAIEIFGDEETEQGLRFNMFHVFQHAGRDGLRGMPAKGLSGEGYERHYFWDTEIYMLPLFTYTNPEIAQKLLSYRYHTLPEARDRARILGHQKGALYPWRTINGQEASTYFPLGTAQYHINADIAYAFMHYYRITGNSDFLFAEGCEVLAETARVWADVGSFSEYRNNQYCICAVTGPDEYNAIVDNNFYTNLMAQQNLYDALEALKLMAVNRSEAYQQLIEKLGLTEEELANWKLIADNMYFPMDKEKGNLPAR